MQKLVQYAYPRQREAYLYKKKLLPPDALNMSVDLMKMKREASRREMERKQMNLTQSPDVN